METIEANEGTPLARRILARKLFDKEKEEGSDSEGILPTVPAHRALPGELLDAVSPSPLVLEMRSEFTSVVSAVAEMRSMMQCMDAYVRSSMPAQQQQQQNAENARFAEAAPPESSDRSDRSERSEQLDFDMSSDIYSQPGAENAQSGAQQDAQPRHQPDAKNGDHCQPQMGTVVSASKLECPISAIQTLLWYEKHDRPLLSERDKRWTVNGPTMYDHIAQNRPEVTKAFQAAVEQPGPQVMAAINEFEASAVAGTALAGIRY